MFKSSSNVKKFSTGVGINDYTFLSPGAMASNFQAKNIVREQADNADEKLDNMDKKDKDKKMSELINKRAIEESSNLNRIIKLEATGKDLVLKNILSEAFVKALYLDDSFKNEYIGNLNKLVENYIDSKGGLKYVKERANITKSHFLKDLVNVCEACSKEVVKRKIKENNCKKYVSEAEEKVPVGSKDKEIISNTDMTKFEKENKKEEKEQLKEACKTNLSEEFDFNFNLTDSESKGLELEKDNLSIDQISELVKQKVFTVIKDEQERSSKEAEVEEEIKSRAEELNVAEESFKFNVSPIEQISLFESLMKRSYKEILQEAYTSHNDDDDSFNFDIVYDEEDASRSEHVDTTEDDVKRGDYDIKDELDDFSLDDDSIPEDDDESINVDMDLVLAESITHYTLLELMHTIKLEDYTSKDVKDLAYKISK